MAPQVKARTRSGVDRVKKGVWVRDHCKASGCRPRRRAAPFTRARALGRRHRSVFAFGQNNVVTWAQAGLYFEAVKGLRFVYWQDGECWLGYLEEYPDYMTQGESLQDLQEHLRDLYVDLSGGYVPAVRKVAELEVA
jgi:hypothetical protein